MARRAHGRAVRVSGGVDALLEAARERRHARDRAREPQRPDRRAARNGRARSGCSTACPTGVAVLLDESLVEFADAQPTDSSLELLEHHPRLLVFRSFSKAWGLAGLRDRLRDRRARLGGAARRARARPRRLRGLPGGRAGGAAQLLGADRRARAAVSAERARLTAALRERHFEVADSQANFLWVAHPRVDGGELSARLARAGVLVAGGDALGEPRHVRIALRDAAASERLLGARSCSTSAARAALSRRPSRPGATARRSCPRGSCASALTSSVLDSKCSTTSDALRRDLQAVALGRSRW